MHIDYVKSVKYSIRQKHRHYLIFHHILVLCKYLCFMLFAFAKKYTQYENYNEND